VFDAGTCKVGIIICYDNQFPEGARVLALRGAGVLLMPHAARMKMWDDTAESEAAARRYSHDYFRLHGMRARENACFAVFADQAGRAGYVDAYPRDAFNQPHHAGGAMVFDPDGHVLASTQDERIRDEMVVQTLDAALLAKQRALPNYTLRTSRPEPFDELLRDQVTC
jgi:predicted amidohydrolase